mmetsp:Transcript_19256/g.41861  ORF Transcript_19256/g.41861 Transcript_19256/m.41861 type:complete len:84 (-) Transcript_19256:222-473(-)
MIFQFECMRVSSGDVISGNSEASKFVIALHGCTNVYSQYSPSIRPEEEKSQRFDQMKHWIVRNTKMSSCPTQRNCFEEPFDQL